MVIVLLTRVCVSENGFHLLLYCVTTQAVLEPAYDDGDTDEEEEATRP